MRVDLGVGSAIPQDAVQKGASAHSHELGKTRGETRFSNRDASLTSLAAAALNAPEVRAAKVEGLREKIASGSYHVSSHQIAASIVDQLRTSRSNRS
jgi:flagellar biosynthesis anti-sigma factor FlgM